MREVLCTLVLLAALASGVDRSKFKTCSQSGFCKRLRTKPTGEGGYVVDPTSLHVSPTQLEVLVTNSNTGVKYKLVLAGQLDQTFRLKITEAYPLRARFEVPLVLDGEPEATSVTVVEQSPSSITLGLGEHAMAALHFSPLRVDFFYGEKLMLSSNSRGMFQFEHTRHKPGTVEAAGDDVGNDVEDSTCEDCWEESYGGHVDPKPHGPQAISMDFTFPSSSNIYGLPQHADTFSLKDTTSTDPYRLYNLDVFEYELWNPMALYASIPYVVSHSSVGTVGLFWLNAAEGWVDVSKGGQGLLGSVGSMFASNTEDKVDTHWMFESGILDVFVLLGPGPADVGRQYARLTGATPLPQEFAIAYHQCRWNYNDQADVLDVDAKFDEHDIPMDVMWLDIEHTDGKKYFTWDGRKFPDSVGMIDTLASKGRKLVTIVDPHIKKDPNYWVHTDLQAKGLYVKNNDGTDYEGWCWPGASYYPDFLNKEARDYFAEQYKLENYKGSTLDCYTWNDMNEPSVFNGPEVTMSKDKKHGEVEHRDVHNMYGMLYTMATHQGQLVRSDHKLRPFILTRSAFAGSQRYAAIWTGDNTAEWSHLEASIPMCLSLSVTGMSFCGADIGGFFGNPDGELFVRWYQAAAYQPFFRSHAHIDTKRREPWLYGAGEMKLIREAVRARYALLPLWYTLFYEGEKTGAPPMRPLWWEFPGDSGTYTLEGSHMVGSQLLVAPVLHKGATSVSVYFPGDGPWYDVDTKEKLTLTGLHTYPAPYEKVPVFQRGGTIVPRKNRIRRSAPLMHDDPITLIIAPDNQGKAQGTLYLDDGQSFAYQSGASIYMHFTWDNGSLTSKMIHKPGMKTAVWLERVEVLGSAPKSGQATIVQGGQSQHTSADLLFDYTNKVLTIRKPGVVLDQEWKLTL